MSKLTAVEATFNLIYNQILEDYESQNAIEACQKVNLLAQRMAFVYSRLFLVIQNHHKNLYSGIIEISSQDALAHLLAQKTNRAVDQVSHMNLIESLLTLLPELENVVPDTESRFLEEETQVNLFFQSHRQLVLSEAARKPLLPEMSLHHFWYLIERANDHGLPEPF